MTEVLQEELRARFRETGRMRVDAMDALLSAIGAGSAQPGSVETLMRHFHAMAGMGATYGFAAVSELGDEGEGLLIPLVRSGASPSAAALVRCRELVALMRAELLAG